MCTSLTDLQTTSTTVKKNKYTISEIVHKPYYHIPGWCEYLIESPNGVIICRCSSLYAAKKIRKALHLLQDKEKGDKI
jgi:hypothetical protein